MAQIYTYYACVWTRHRATLKREPINYAMSESQEPSRKLLQPPLKYTFFSPMFRKEGEIPSFSPWGFRPRRRSPLICHCRDDDRPAKHFAVMNEGDRGDSGDQRKGGAALCGTEGRLRPGPF